MNHRLTFALLLFCAPLGCGKDAPDKLPDAGASDLAASSTDLAGADLAGGTAFDPQTPPQGGAPLMAWLSAGYYKSWHCEAAAHPAGPNGAHGTNRVCSNTLQAGTGGSGEFPVGSASVKELYSGSNVVGYAVSLRIKTGPNGDSWYWYENGFGGVGISSCTGCHSKAGSGGTYIGRDYVFVRVP